MPKSKGRGGSPAPRRTSSGFLGGLKDEASKMFHKFHPIEGGMNFGLGLVGDKLLDESGIAEAIFTWAAASNNPIGQGLATWMNNQRVNAGYSGGKAINKLIGGVTGLGVSMKSGVFGKPLTAGDVSGRIPFVLGTVFDAPEGSQGPPMGAGALTAIGGNRGSSAQSGGWV